MKPKKCIDCGKTDAGSISTNGLCYSCGAKRSRNAANQIRNKAGPVYEKWKAKLKASVE